MDASPYYYAYTRGLPSGTQHAEVALITPLCILLRCCKQFRSFVRELLCYGSET